MRRTEKIVLAAVLVVLGVLLMVFQENVVKMLMTVIGATLIAFGMANFFHRTIFLAVVKTVAGVVAIILGVFAVNVVLYLLAGLLLILGVLFLYGQLKIGNRCRTHFQNILAYALPVICLVLGVLLLFNNGEEVSWVFVLGGILVLAEGGLLFADALLSD